MIHRRGAEDAENVLIQWGTARPLSPR
jgi:hypothetical protein